MSKQQTQQHKLPAGWQEVELGEICELKKGSSITKDKITKGDIPVIAGGQKPAYYHNISNRAGETITVSASGAYAGFVAYFNIPLFASDCSTIQSRGDNVFMRYIYYFLKGNQKQIYKMQKGIAQPHVYSKDLELIKIPLPPLAPQKKIVSILEKAEKLRQKRKEADEKTAEYVESEFHKIFEKNDFEKVKLGNVCELNPKKSEIGKQEDLEVSFVPMADVKEHQIYFNLNETRKIKEVYTGYTYFKENDVLLAKVTPCFENGKSGIAKNLKNKIGFGSSEFYVLRALDKILPQIIYYVISSGRFINSGKKQMSGTGGLKRLSKSYVINYEIPLPPLALQQKFARIVEKVEKMKEKQKESKEKIDELFNSLMQKAFRGELVR